VRLSRSFWNLLAVGGTTASRLIGVLILYALLARMLGPAGFGEFTYWYTVGIVLGALSDYGFGQQILIRLSADSPEKIKQEGERLIVAKLILVMFFFLAALVFAIYQATEPESLYWIVSLMFSCACATLIEFFGVMLRARAQYENEALRSFLATFVASVGAAIVGYFFESLVVVCLVMFFVRLIVLFFQYAAAKNAVKFDGVFGLMFSIQEPLETLRNGFKYGADAGAGQLLSNIDVLLAKYLLTSESAGIYMAGNRLVQAALSGIPVLSNVFIPSLVVRRKNGIRETIPLLRMVVLFVSLSLVVVLYFGAPYIPGVLFGPRFLALSDFLPIFGVAISLRYLLTLDAFYLAINDRQIDRAIVQLIMVVISIICAAYFYHAGGFSGIILAYIMAFVGLIQLAVYRLLVFLIK